MWHYSQLDVEKAVPIQQSRVRFQRKEKCTQKEGLMPAIFIKKEKDSSRNRRRERRKTAREQSYDEGHLIRKAAIELHGGAAQLKAEKAISGMTEFEKCKQKKEFGEDAMYHKVNHAHQRNANKKWS